MLKRILAAVCVVTILVGLVAAAFVQVSAASMDYQVGFARVDINPYVVDGDINSGIMELPLRGSGDVWNRLSTYGLIDDNGDKKVDENDGLAVTCIAVTDYTGKTILLITIDLIGGVMLDRVRKGICERVDAAIASGELSNVELAEDQIYYAGTHTHNAPDTTVYTSKGKTGTNNDGVDLSVVNENLGIWMDRTVEDIEDSVILALKDRAAAKITKDQISASAATSAAVKGKVMNSVRHYNNYYADGTLNCVAGDNFNTRGSNPKQVTQVNDTMYLLQFDFTEHNKSTGDNKLNIILANWRGHPSLNNRNSDYSSRNCVSSDFVNAFRHAVEYNCYALSSGKALYYSGTQKYRAAFFQASGGNVNPRGYELINGTRAYAWIDNAGKNNGECYGNGYGRILAAMAQEGLNSKSDAVAVDPGKILSLQYTYNSTRKQIGYSQLAYEAGKSYQANLPSLPYAYTNDAGETYVIGSKFHASNVAGNWDEALQKSSDALVGLEVSAFLFDDDLAFVTAPGEPFDYYYNEDGSNAWNNLIRSTYGTPFVLGYCNGAAGYIPNNKAYYYNEGSTKWTTGSYETHITKYAPGTGEHMIDIMEHMLDTMSTGETFNYDANCQHCRQTVTWEPYTGSATLGNGHYYLLEDTKSPQIHIEAGAQVCFDLNGYTIQGENRVFYTETNGNSSLNIMDSSPDQTGVAMGCGGDFGSIKGFGGGTVIIDKTNTLNLYGGTLSAYERGVRQLRSGGVLLSKGTVNMYGGRITGGVVHAFTGMYLLSGVPTEEYREALAGTVYSTGTLNIYGGTVDQGECKLVTGTVTGNEADGYRYSQTVTPVESKGHSVYATGSVMLAGNPHVADLYFAGSSASLLTVDAMNVPFTGSVQLTHAKGLATNDVVGSCNAEFLSADAVVTFAGTDLLPVVKDGKLLAARLCAAVCDEAGEGQTYISITDAMSGYSAQNGKFIRLLCDTTEDITVDRDVYLDLNGFDIGGAVAVSEGSTLWCMDSQTDDYTVADGNYGLLTGAVTGAVESVPAGTVGAKESDMNLHRAGYLMCGDEQGISFHRVNLQLTKLSLRCTEAGLYYTGTFAGDEVVKNSIESFGIALDAVSAPNEKSMLAGGTSLYTQMPRSQWMAEDAVSGAMLSGIMKPGNSDAQNRKNAETMVHGRAYIRTADGFVFGNSVSWSLRALVEIADGNGLLQSTALDRAIAMYHDYPSVMKYWDIPQLKQALEAEQ